MADIENALRNGTGEGCQFWMDFIGNSIAMHSTHPEGAVHGDTQSNLWLRDLANTLWERIPLHHDLTVVDENIISAHLMSLILTLWTCRIIKAKACDKRRPVHLRQQAMRKGLLCHQQLVQCISDESRDHEFFPAQEWELPFPPGATDGDYV